MSQLTVKGGQASSQQRKVAQELLDVAHKLNAGPLATEAIIVSAIQETELGPTNTLQATVEASASTTEQAKKFLLGGTDFQEHGAIAYARKHPSADPITVGEAVEKPLAGNYHRGASDASKIAEAKAWVAAYGGASSGTGETGHEGETGNAKEKYEFQIASDEDYWTGLQKVAQEVQWLLYFEGDNLVYEHPYELIRRQPLCEIDPVENKMATNCVIDDTTGERQFETQTREVSGVISQFSFDCNSSNKKAKVTKDKKGKHERVKGGITTEVSFQLTCEPNFIQAGDVVVLTDPTEDGHHAPWSSGAWLGRWIVVDVTRSIFNVYSEVTLAIPGTSSLPAPLDEPKGESVAAEKNAGGSGSSSSGSPSSSSGPASVESGTKEEWAIAAFNAADSLSRKQLHYTWGGGHGQGQLGSSVITGLDCSGSVCWVLHEAGFGMFPSTAAWDSTELENWGDPGEGSEMTVWTGPNHAYIEFKIPGHQPAQLNTNGHQNGPRLYTLAQGGSYNGEHGEGSGGPFQPRHWSGATKERFGKGIPKEAFGH